MKSLPRGSTCGFCHGQRVYNAASWLDGKPRPPAECPRCGAVVEQPHEAWPIIEHEPEHEPVVPPDLCDDPPRWLQLDPATYRGGGVMRRRSRS